MYCNIRRNKIAHDDGNTPFVMDGSPTIPSVENKKVDDVLVFDTQSDASKHKDWFHIVSTEGKSSGELSSRSDILLPTKISTDTGFRRRWFRMGNPRKMVSIRSVDAIASRTSLRDQSIKAGTQDH
jgi:hypothetical protein